MNKALNFQQTTCKAVFEDYDLDCVGWKVAPCLGATTCYHIFKTQIFVKINRFMYTLRNVCLTISEPHSTVLIFQGNISQMQCIQIDFIQQIADALEKVCN